MGSILYLLAIIAELDKRIRQAQWGVLESRYNR
jgi:hypothetical protein